MMATTVNGKPKRLKQEPWTMKYLFAAQFVDGTRIEQTLEDISKFDASRSAYYDVLKRIEGGAPLAFFGLTDGENFYVVDLRDGHFEVNSVSFVAQPVGAPILPAGGTFSLIYQRDHQQDLIVDREEHRMGEHRIAWRFGWRYEVGQKSWEQTIVVA